MGERVCFICGKERDDACHEKYGNDVNNPRKHRFELYPTSIGADGE